uniref:Uncharacterized protein n=1 Tax=Plectus sambesii TaxID=2011161 RepID=A0A914UTZ7_9BILA
MCAKLNHSPWCASLTIADVIVVDSALQAAPLALPFCRLSKQRRDRLRPVRAKCQSKHRSRELEEPRQRRSMRGTGASEGGDQERQRTSTMPQSVSGTSLSSHDVLDEVNLPVTTSGPFLWWRNITPILTLVRRDK